MDPNTFPDDIWFEIFAILPPRTLVFLQIISKHFRALIARPLLENVFWVQLGQTHNNILEWNDRIGFPETLPQTAAIEVPLVILEETTRMICGVARKDTEYPDIHLYLAMQTQLVRFSSLHTLVFTGTSLDIYMFTAISLLPALRNLHIDRCSFIDMLTDDLDDDEIIDPPPPISSLPLTHLTLGINSVKPDDIYLHPIALIKCTTLESLEITMNANMARYYHEHILHLHPRYFGAHAHFAHMQNGQQQPVVPTPSPRDNAPAPNLRFLKIYIPQLTNDMMQYLAHLTLPRPGNTQLAPDGVTLTALPPRLTLKVDSSIKLATFKLAAEQIKNYCYPYRYQHRRMWATKTPLVQGICNYTGPPGLFSSFIPLPSANEVATIQPAIHTDMNNDGSLYFGFRGYQLENVCFTPVCADPPSGYGLPFLLRMVENASLLQNRSETRPGLYKMETSMLKWDAELLYAVAALWRDIESLVIRVGTEIHVEAILIIIGSDIIWKLRKIHTLRIIEDLSIMYEPSPSKCSLAPTLRGEEVIETVRDYVLSWTRDCPSIRRVQIGGPVGWKRRWEGAKWERWVPDSTGM